MDSRLRNLLNRRSRLPIENYGLMDDKTRNESERQIPGSSRPSVLKQPRTNSSQETSSRPDSHAPVIRSFSYDAVSAGKAPTIGTVPVKGNGPVRLQTSRRLSSGELIATTQDSRRTLQDIREGEYIVGRKDRPASRAPTTRASTSQSITRRMMSPSTSYYSNFGSPASQTWSDKPLSINSDTSFQHRGGYIHNDEPNFGLGLSSPSSHHQPEQTYPFLESPISDTPSFRPSISTPRPSSRSRTRESATLEALRRAEYGRLVEVYGEAMTLQEVTQLEEGFNGHLSSSTTPQAYIGSPSFHLEPLPSPHLNETGPRQRRGSDTSGIDSFGEANSGQSSLHRASNVSSHDGASTATAQTSVVEEDPEDPAEDIRKLVAQLRSNYLTALNARPLPPPLPKSQKKRRRMNSLSSPVIQSESLLSPKSTPPLTQGQGGRQTWHAQNEYISANASKRLHSAPNAPPNRLSTIRAASPDNDDANIAPTIRRADSTALGGLMAEVTRNDIRNETDSYLENCRTEDDINAIGDALIIHNSHLTESQTPAQSTGLFTTYESRPHHEFGSRNTDHSHNLQAHPESYINQEGLNSRAISSVHRFPSLALSRAERSDGTRSGYTDPVYKAGKERGRHHRHQSCTPVMETSNHEISETDSTSPTSTPLPTVVETVGIPKPPGNFF